jgi:hypothetical protein
MMSLLIAWVAFPLVLAVLSLGCGLLLEAISGVRLPGLLVIAAGLTSILVALEFATITSATASLATPLVVGLAVGGLARSAAAATALENSHRLMTNERSW